MIWKRSLRYDKSRIHLDHPSPLGFPADGRVWVPAWVNAQSLLTSSQSEYREMIHSGVVEKASSFLLKKTDSMDHVYHSLRAIHCKNGLTSIETLWASRISTPQRPIAAQCFWSGLSWSALGILLTERYGSRPFHVILWMLPSNPS